LVTARANVLVAKEKEQAEQRVILPSGLWLKPEEAKRFVALCAAQLDDKDIQVRRKAADGLARLGAFADTSSAVPAMMRAMKDPDPKMREYLAWALHRAGPKSTLAIPMLLEFLQDKHAKVREAAAVALAGMGKAAKETKESLEKVLRDRDKYVRLQAAVALGAIGVFSKDAEEIVIAAFADEDEKYSALAAHISGDIGIAIVPLAIRCTRDKRANVRSGGVGALGQIALRANAGQLPFPREATLTLVAALNDPVEHIAVKAADSLGFAGREPKEVIPALVKALKHPQHMVRYYAAKAIGMFGPNAKVAISALEDVSRNDSAYTVRERAKASINEIQKKR
jgi:HEAT repeat protein